MSLNVSAWSIRRPLPAVVASMIFVFLGAISFGVLPITRLPNVDVPIVSVAVGQFGAAPSELDSQVSKPIEDAISGVEGVRHIISNITDGLSVTVVQFQLETNTDRALNDVKDAVTRVRSKLPQNISEPLIQRVDVVGLPIVTYAAAAPGKTPEQLSYFVDDVVKRALQGVRGVGQVERIGGVEREISVALDPDHLQALGLTASDVSRQLRGTRVDVAGGRAEIGGRDQSIRTLAAATTISGIAGSMISLPTGGQIRLDDLGVVTDSIAEPKTFARVDGKSVVGFSILRSKNASDVTVADGVARKVAQIHAEHPDVDLTLIDNSTDFTRGNYEAAIQTLFEGAALAVLVVLIFLRDLRATFIAAIALPLSIMPAFWAMDILGFSLNLVSMLAITLSTGILVDDSIVEIENIERHMAMGKSPFMASIEAADEIGPAVIAISLTIIAVFVPVSFMGSVAGQFFKQFGVTISVQVFFSLLAARFVTPVLAAYFLKPKTRDHAVKPPGPVLRRYTSVLEWSVRHYFLTVALGVVLFVLAIFSTKLLPSGFLPAQDISRSLLAIELPPGTPLSATENVTEEIAKRLTNRPEVKSVFVDGGRIPPATQEVRKASLIINYVPKGSRSYTQRQLELAISQDLQNHSRYPLLVSRRERPPRRGSRRDRPGQQYRRERRGGTRHADAAHPDHRQCGLFREPRSAGIANSPQPRSRRPSRRLDRGLVRNHPRRDDRRRRTGAREAERRRPADRHPRTARRQRKRIQARAGAAACSAPRRQGRHPARIRRQRLARAGTDQHHALRSRAPGRRRRGSRRYGGDRPSHGGHQQAARHDLASTRSQRQAVRRCREHEGSCRRL